MRRSAVRSPARRDAAPPAHAADAGALLARIAGSATHAQISEAPLPNVAAALQKRKKLKILAIGASATAGRRGRRGGYTEQIEDILEKAIKGLDVVIINRGVSGELAADAATRIRNEVALHEPDLVLWQVGTNDALAYVPLGKLSRRDRRYGEVAQGASRRRCAGRPAIRQAVGAGRSLPGGARADPQGRSGGERGDGPPQRGDAAPGATPSAAAVGCSPRNSPQTETGYACLAEYVARAITLAAFGGGLRPQPAPLQAPQPVPPQAQQPR